MCYEVRDRRPSQQTAICLKSNLQYCRYPIIFHSFPVVVSTAKRCNSWLCESRFSSSLSRSSSSSAMFDGVQGLWEIRRSKQQQSIPFMGRHRIQGLRPCLYMRSPLRFSKASTTFRIFWES